MMQFLVKLNNPVNGPLRENKQYESPEDAYAFGRLLVYMFANWSLAWKLIFFPMKQVERFFF